MTQPGKQAIEGVPAAGSQRAKAILTKLGPLIGLIFVWGLFAVSVGSDFMEWHNQRLILLQATVVATAAIGATLIIISGGIDLSVGSAIAFGTMVVALVLQVQIGDWRPAESMPIVWPFLAVLGGVLGGAVLGLGIGAMVIGHIGRVAALLAAVLITVYGWGRITPFGAVPLGLVAGAVVLLINEKLVKRIELSPFIVTLGMWGALRGAAKGLGNNQPLYPEQTWVTGLMETADSGIGSIMAPGVWIMLALALLAAGVLRYTRFGRHVFAIGSSEETARLCGVHVERSKLMIYAIAIACAGLAAVMQFSYLNGIGDPTTAEGYELKVIAAVVIGGASLAGGEGSIMGTIVGALIMFVVDNGCTQLEYPNYVQEIVTGAIIVAAVALDRLRHRQSD
jgi:ribose/xylose/arabinose/galactoside ABC-type transport system permease subunit